MENYSPKKQWKVICVHGMKFIMEWKNRQVKINVPNLFHNLFAPELPLPTFLFWIPSLGLNSQKKQTSHITNFHYWIYKERKIISETSLIIKLESMIVAWNRLSASISSCKNKSTIKRKFLKENHNLKLTIRSRLFDVWNWPCATVCQIGN
jgi:hypothetical protein